MADLVVTPRFTIPRGELNWTASRSSGPGGQNVNKVNTKVTLRWTPRPAAGFDEGWRRRVLSRHAGRINAAGELILHSDRTRDQTRNLADVRSRLVSLLLECRAAPVPRRKTKPTKGSVRRRLESKKQTSQKKQNRGGRYDVG